MARPQQDGQTHQLAFKDCSWGSTFLRFGYDTRQLAQFIFESLQQSKAEDDKCAARGERKSSSIELLIGILVSGSSYVLCTREQMGLITSRVPEHLRRRTHGPSRPDRADFYASISPIIFESAESLHEKIKTYTQKKKKNAGGAPFIDTSVANKAYQHGDTNFERPSFEHQR